ncbi:tetratricopeptide repeat protein [Chloroflexus sp.]|uniref:tetratricopeptide repeat protein n=1 Tax=Chloroflexus sp. TaxID=1904827 RepID=UPI002ACD51C1|nr:tetratricopeptide repeat protein [Chloroflexus sp.]
MATQPFGSHPIPRHRFAAHRLGRVLLQTPELVALLVSMVWMDLTGWSPLAVTLGAMSGLWFLARYLLLWHARRYFQRGRYHKATALAGAARRMNPYSADVYWLLGISALQRNRPTLAVAYLQQACRLDPDNPKLYAALAAAHVLAEEPDAAIRYAQYARYLQPNTFEATMVMSDCAAGDQQIEHYLRAALPCARRPSDRAVIYCALADHLLKTGRRTEAVSYLAQAIRLAPVCPPATRGSLHYQLGELLWHCGEPEMAYEQFCASLKVDPHGPYPAKAWRAAALGLANQSETQAGEQPTAAGEVIELVPEQEKVSHSA